MDVRQALKPVAGAIGASLLFAAVVTLASLWRPPKSPPRAKAFPKRGPSGTKRWGSTPLPNQTYPLDRKGPGEPRKKGEA